MTFKVANITRAVAHSFNICVGLQGPGWPYVLGMPPRGDLPLWTPRARATDLGQRPNLRARSMRVSCVPRSREHEKKTRGPKRKKCRSAKKEHSYSKVHIIVIWYNITYVCMHTWYSISSEVARKQRITFWSLWLPSLPDDNPFLQNTRLGSLLHLAARLSWSSNEFGPRGLSCRRPLLGDRPSRQCSGSLTSGRISSVIRRLHYNFDTIIWLCSSSQTWHILFTLFDGKRSGAVSIFV